jgi:hypothetical protein
MTCNLFSMEVAQAATGIPHPVSICYSLCLWMMGTSCAAPS